MEYVLFFSYHQNLIFLLILSYIYWSDLIMNWCKNLYYWYKKIKMKWNKKKLLAYERRSRECTGYSLNCVKVSLVSTKFHYIYAHSICLSNYYDNYGNYYNIYSNCQLIMLCPVLLMFSPVLQIIMKQLNNYPFP